MTPDPAPSLPPPYRSWQRDGGLFTTNGGPGVTILMYHKIGAPLTGSRLHDLYVSPRDFDRQLAELAAAGQRALPYSDALSAIAAGETGVCLTLDDAFANVFDHALPILQARGVRGAMLFVVAGLIGRTDEWDTPIGEPPQPLMDATQIRAWLAAGHEIGAHTLSHPRLAEISSAQARAEVFDSKARLEDEFGVSVRHFCYPYGNYNPRVRDLVAEAGYETACAAATNADTFGPNHPGNPPLELRRIMACNRPSLTRAVARKVARLVHRRTYRSP